LLLCPRSDRLVTIGPKLITDLRLREERTREFARFIAEHSLTRPYLNESVRRLTNRWATREDDELTGYDADGAPKGCSRCSVCQEFEGFYAPKNRANRWGNNNGRSTASTIHCACANTNRCARCGELLPERKLRVHYYDENNHRIAYLSGLHALQHRAQRSISSGQ
jgi:hypothetical protein